MGNRLEHIGRKDPSASATLPGIRQVPVFCSCCGVFFCFYLWIFSRTPYQLDDWFWGTPLGMSMFLTGGLNGRYPGNLLEVVVSRSSFLKAVLPGLIATMIPLCMTWISVSVQASEKSSITTEKQSRFWSSSAGAWKGSLSSTSTGWWCRAGFPHQGQKRSSSPPSPPQ